MAPYYILYTKLEIYRGLIKSKHLEMLIIIDFFFENVCDDNIFIFQRKSKLIVPKAK